MWAFTIDRKVGIVEAKVQLWDESYRFAGFACCMIRKKVFREIGLFDKHFLIGGDLEFWARFMWNGKYKIEFCDDTDIFHSCGATLTHGALKDKREELDTKYRKELLAHIYTTQFLKNTLAKINHRRVDEETKRGWRS
jgi:GT2 family glycosyltransferase